MSSKAVSMRDIYQHANSFWVQVLGTTAIVWYGALPQSSISAVVFSLIIVIIEATFAEEVRVPCWLSLEGPDCFLLLSVFKVIIKQKYFNTVWKIPSQNRES